MTTLIGKPLTGKDLEMETRTWPSERFPSLCDALIWVISSHQYPGLPLFTSRVNVADGGIDAEWSVDLSDDNSLSSPMISPGWNVFQYKQRDIGVRDKGEIISRLKGKDSLGGALVKLVSEHKKTPSNYVLFLNIDLDPEKRNFRSNLRDAILEGYSNIPSVRVEIVGAAEIAAMLNNFPHLRAAYFTPRAFKTWETAHTDHLKTGARNRHSRELFGADVELIGRESELNQIRALVDDARVRVIILAGPHDIGKSRLALDATAHRPYDVVMAADPRTMALQDYRSMAESPREVVCIVEDPEAENLDRIVDEALTLDNLTLLVTLPTLAHAPMPLYGRDDRVQTVEIKALDIEQSRNLLKAAGHPLDFELEDWIIEHAGGIPGVLLSAAGIGIELRGDQEDFEQSVGREFAKRAESALGSEALDIARLLSLMTHVGVSGPFEEEMKHLVRIFGDGLTPHDVLNLIEKKLIPAGLAQRGGSFVEITLPLLANYLTRELLVGRPHEIFALFATLTEAGRIRILKRLSELSNEPVVEQFWEAFFTGDSLLQIKTDIEQGYTAELRYQDTGTDIHSIWTELSSADSPLYDLSKGIKEAQLLEFLAGVKPLQTLELIESILLDSTYKNRRSIARERRRDLMEILEQLLFRSVTSRRALHLIWLLAEAENEPYANNATGVLTECLNFRHWQMPLPLRERLDAIRTFTDACQPKRARLVAIYAAGKIFEDRNGHIRHSKGGELLDGRSKMTWGDVYDYNRDVIDLLFTLAQSEDQDISQAAQSSLPKMIGQLSDPRYGRPEDAVERLGGMLDQIQQGQINEIDITEASNAVSTAHYNINKIIEQNSDNKEEKKKYQALLSHIDQLKKAALQGKFEIRLKRWTGAATWEDRQAFVNNMDQGRMSSENVLSQLADEAIQSPESLESTMDWLLSPAAHKAPDFFQMLGRNDKAQYILPDIEAIGKEDQGAGLFANYWQGWAQRDRQAAETHLVELSQHDEITGSALILAAIGIDISESTIDLILLCLKTGRVNPKIAAYNLISSKKWLDEISLESFEQIIDAIIGENLEQAGVILDLIGMWQHLERPLDGKLAEYAWRCLETDPELNKQEPWWYEIDIMAAHIAEQNPDRGLALLNKLLTREDKGHHWNPIESPGEHRFWDMLYRYDKAALLTRVFNIAKNDDINAIGIVHDLKKILDQKDAQDILVNLSESDSTVAALVAECITSETPGFMPIANKLLNLYPVDEKIRSKLALNITYPSDIIIGSESQHLNERFHEVEDMLQDPTTSSVFRDFLREIAERFKKESARKAVWEYDLDINDLRHYIEDKQSPQRLWAIGRVLKYADMTDVQRLLTIEDIAEALPQIDLPEKKRHMLERALEVWQHAV